MHYKQNRVYKRVLLSVPIFLLSGVLMFINFDILWRYFAWFNQSLSVITLWAVTVWLTRRSVKEGRKPYAFFIALIPALWMTLVCSTYIIIAPEGFQLNYIVAYVMGGLVTLGALVWFILWAKKLQKA
jgi:carbon starvation protein CstA